MKKLISILLALALIMTLATGCAKKETAREILTQGMAVTTDSVSTEMVATLNLQVPDSILQQDPSIQSITDMVNAGSLTMNMAQDKLTGNSNGTVTIATNGLSYTMDMYTLGFSQFIMKTPLDERYVTLDTGMSSETGTKEEMDQLAKIATDTMLEKITDEQLSVEYDVDFSGKDGDTKLNYVTLAFDHDAMIAFLKDIMPVIYSNDLVMTNMKDNLKAQNESYGIEMTDEQVDEQVAQIVEGFPTMIDQMTEYVTFDNVTFKFGFNKDYHMVDQAVTVNATATDGTETFVIGLEVKGEQFAFNQPVAATDIQITEENSMTMEDLIMMLMFSGFGF